VKKPTLSIDHRINALLEHGIENPKKWAAVHGYEQPVMMPLDAEWQRLRQHHLEETGFLFSMLGAMRTRMLELQKENEELKKRPQPDPYDDKYCGSKIR
jgi:hypothetical protein